MTASIHSAWGDDGIATLTIDRPHAMNALAPAVMAELLSALRAAIADARTRAIVLTGKGRAFSAGADLLSFGPLLAGGPDRAQDELGRIMEEAGNPITQTIADCPVPVVSAVNGACAGGAVGIALAADAVIAARSAYFLVPQVPQLGLVPDLGATWMLARLLGRSRALGIALLGERIDAAQAEQWGLIWRCVDDAELLSQAQTIALRLAGAAAAAVRESRRQIDAAPANTLARQLSDERAAQLPLATGGRLAEACARFLARPAHD
jgi:2-(1,2-epoxy-1,2-dihydrophenyl)acetyl-CoA isomerase